MKPAAIGQEGTDVTDNVTVDRKLWLTADRDALVEDGDPKAAFLWATEGDEVAADEAKQLSYKAKPSAGNKAKSAPANKGKQAKGDQPDGKGQGSE